MKHEDSLHAYLNNMESLITQLDVVRLPLGKDDRVVVLLLSIEKIPKFCDIILALCVARDMSFSDTIAMLLDHER